jgi:hypothetical protein
MSEQHQAVGGVSGNDVGVGIATIVGGVGLFVLCSVIQASWGQSSMFSASYVRPESGFQDLMITMTFYPGWVMTAVLVITGGLRMFGIKR